MAVVLLGSLGHVEEVDLGVNRAQLFPGDSQRSALLLPGARYPPAAPLLWFARETLQARGWTVLQISNQWDRSEDATSWVTARLSAGLGHLGDRQTRLVVAKSLTTLALPETVEKGLPGIWLTPLLGQDVVRTALARASAPTLVIGGTADPTWDSEFVAGLTNVEVCDIDGADHGLQFPDDPLRSLDALKTVTKRIAEFVDHLI